MQNYYSTQTKTMKICLISYDSTYFDHHIVLELKRQNIDAKHIDITKIKYQYPSGFSKITNFFYKLFFKKNLKKIAIENKLIKQVEKLGHQDIIMFVRPDNISRESHEQLKIRTTKYISYIYDSCTRFPIDHLLDGIFDEIYSFDIEDSKKYNFNFIPNYIYLEKNKIQSTVPENSNVFIVLSIDERLPILNNLANYFSTNNIGYKFILVGKKKPKNLNPNIIYSNKTLLPSELIGDLKNCSILLDLIRIGHNGLSFRIFEALALQKKIITTNKYIKEYDFYNPNNILIIDENNININPNFFTTAYEPLSEAIYNKYTIKNWVNAVFKLN